MSPLILTKQLTVKGFVAPRFLTRWNEAFKEISQWITEVSYNSLRGRVHFANEFILVFVIAVYFSTEYLTL